MRGVRPVTLRAQPEGCLAPYPSARQAAGWHRSLRSRPRPACVRSAGDRLAGHPWGLAAAHLLVVVRTQQDSPGLPVPGDLPQDRPSRRARPPPAVGVENVQIHGPPARRAQQSEVLASPAAASAHINGVSDLRLAAWASDRLLPLRPRPGAAPDRCHPAGRLLLRPAGAALAVRWLRVMRPPGVRPGGLRLAAVYIGRSSRWHLAD